MCLVDVNDADDIAMQSARFDGPLTNVSPNRRDTNRVAVVHQTPIIRSDDPNPFLGIEEVNIEICTDLNYTLIRAAFSIQ